MLTGGISNNSGSGGLGGGLFGGIGSLLSGLVSATGGGGTLTGGAATDGSVAPQYYSGGLFGIGAKEIPGLTAAPKNVTYADQVQGYALNPPNIPSAAPLALSPMSGPNFILPGYASNGGAGIQGGGGYAVPTVATLPGMPGGAPPGGGPVQAPMSQSAPQMVSGGEGSAMPGSPGQPLQGYVSNQPAQPGQAPWMGQIGQLAQGAADFAGQLFGGQPAYAATPARNNSGLAVPPTPKPPPPMTPGVYQPGSVPQAMTPQQAMQAAQQQYPSDQTFGQLAQEKTALASQLGGELGKQAFGAPSIYASLQDLRKDLNAQAKQVAAGVDVYAKQLRQAYTKALDTRFNTPRSDLRDQDANGNPVGPPMTVMQWRNQLESQIKQLNAESDQIAAQKLTPEMVMQARMVVNHANEHYARGAEALGQPTRTPAGIYGIFGRTRPGNPLAAVEADKHRDPILQQQTAINVAQANLDARRQHELLINATLRQDREARLANINKELSEATGRTSEGEKMIFEMRKQAVDSFYQNAKMGLDAFIGAGNQAALVYRGEMDAMQHQAQQRTLDETLALNARKYGDEVQQKNRDLEAKVAGLAGQQELGAVGANTNRINALTTLLKNPDTSEEMKTLAQKEIQSLINQKPGTASTVKQGPTTEASKSAGARQL